MAASKGLGRAVATRFAREGATVLITSSDPDNLADAKEHVRSETGTDEDAILTAVCDLESPDTVEDALESAISRLGGVDMLVTNHGGTTPTSFADATVGDFDAAYESVLKSTVVTVKTALPYLEDGGGSITNLVAASAAEPPKKTVVGSTLRSGLFTLSKSIADEYGDRGIRSNCVCPRGVETGRIEYKIQKLADDEDISLDEARAIRTDELPVGRLGSPAEFAKVVVFVASEAGGAYVTGEAINVDGGWHRRTV